MMNFVAPKRTQKTSKTEATPLAQPPKRLTDNELAQMQRRRPGTRVTLACEGMYLSAEDESLIAEMDSNRLTPEARIARVKEVISAEILAKAPVAR